MRQADPRMILGSQGSQEEVTACARGLGQERLLKEDRCRAREGRVAPGGTEEQQRKSPITGSHFTLDDSERFRPGSWHNWADGVGHHGWTQGWSEGAR